MFPPKQLLLVTICGLTIFVAANSTNAQKFNNNRPSVYITFGEFLSKTPDPSYPTQGVKLIVHNNTRWPVYFTESYDSTVAGGQIVYSIEGEDGQRRSSTAAHVVMKKRLNPGKTLTFVLPRANLSKGNEIDIEFNFSWELNRGDLVRDEVIHRAYFLANDLPAWPK